MTSAPRVLAAVAIAIAAAVPAAGQDAGRPFPAVFGGSATDPTAAHVLDANVSLSAAYDDNGEEIASQSPFETSGLHNAVAGTLAYAWRGRTVQFGANAGAEGRYYEELRQFYTVNRYAGVGASAALGRRTRVELNQTIRHSPAFFTGLFPVLSSDAPGAVHAPGADFAVSDLNARSLDTTASLGFGLAEGRSLEFNSSFGRTAFDAGTDYQDLQAVSVGGRYLHRITRNASLRLGYAYRRGAYGFVGSGRDASLHDLDVGVDYARALSLLRRTEIDFGTGSTIVNQPIDGATSRLQYRVTGSVGLNHQLTRTWRARLAYNRGAGLVAGFPEPSFSDGVTLSLGGFVNRRVDVSFAGGYTTGEVGAASTDNGLAAYTGSARARFALHRSLAVHTEYVYYRYDVGVGVQLPDRVSLSTSGARFVPG